MLPGTQNKTQPRNANTTICKVASDGTFAAVYFDTTHRCQAQEAAPSGSCETASCHQQGLSVSDSYSQSQLPTQISSPFTQKGGGHNHILYVDTMLSGKWRRTQTNTATLLFNRGGVLKWTLLFLTSSDLCWSKHAPPNQGAEPTTHRHEMRHSVWTEDIQRREQAITGQELPSEC